MPTTTMSRTMASTSPTGASSETARSKNASCLACAVGTSALRAGGAAAEVGHLDAGDEHQQHGGDDGKTLEGGVRRVVARRLVGGQHAGRGPLFGGRGDERCGRRRRCRGGRRR